MDLGRVGVWTYQLDLQTSDMARTAAREIEAMGFKTLWISDGGRREVFTNASLLLGATERLVLATGIANIAGRLPRTTAAAQRTLAEAFPDRFILGLGVGHDESPGSPGPTMVMRAYLEAMSRAGYGSPLPVRPCPNVLAALGPRMMSLAGELTDGAHPYHVTPDHTRNARALLGPDKLLIPEQPVVLIEDAARSRAVARRRLSNILRLPNYVRSLKRLGFLDSDLADGGSNRLVDALFTSGGADAAARRIREHLDAGADQVAVQVMVEDDRVLPWREWEYLAKSFC